MNTNKMKNIVVLKNLQSNLIEEAFVVLKQNKKAKVLEHIDNQNANSSIKTNTNDYIIKEAEMIISNYLDKIEKDKKWKNLSIKQIENKYKRLQKVTIALGVATGILVLFAI